MPWDLAPSRCDSAPPNRRPRRAPRVCGFDIDESHAGADCFLDFRVRLADAREHDAVRVEARGPRAAQLPHGHDIAAGTELLQHAQDTEVAVGFDGVANAMAHVVEGIG